MANRAITAKHMIKYIKKANVAYSVSDNTVAGASEFFRQMKASNTVKNNPKFKIEFTHLASGSDPVLSLEFVNSTKLQINPSKMKFKEIFEELEPAVHQIDSELEEKGKTIDSLLA